MSEKPAPASLALQVMTYLGLLICFIFTWYVLGQTNKAVQRIEQKVEQCK